MQTFPSFEKRKKTTEGGCAACVCEFAAGESSRAKLNPLALPLPPSHWVSPTSVLAFSCGGREVSISLMQTHARAREKHTQTYTRTHSCALYRCPWCHGNPPHILSEKGAQPCQKDAMVTFFFLKRLLPRNL